MFHLEDHFKIPSQHHYCPSEQRESPHNKMEGREQPVVRGMFDQLLNVKVPEVPPWRSSDASSVDNTITQMIEDLVQYKIKFDSIIFNKSALIFDEMKIHYITQANIGEDEGTKDLKSTTVALEKIDEKSSVSSDDEQVSINLYLAINHLERINKGEDMGLLDVEECIQNTHALIMHKILPSDKLGEFSIEERVAEYRGKIHKYPRFFAKEEAYTETLRIIDQYNSTVYFIKSCKLQTSDKFFMYFRCAAWILHKFVALHPFADGNGRMCRLLASYCLYIICPFPCPIYNVYAPIKREDYLDAVIKAEESNGKELGSLVAMLIECAWHSYTKLFYSIEN